LLTFFDRKNLINRQ